MCFRIWHADFDIDVAGRLLDGSMIYGECKWWKDPVGENVLDQLIERASLTSYGRDDPKRQFILYSRAGFTSGLKKRAISQESIVLHTPQRLSPLLGRYLETCLATPFGFHEILNYQPGIGFTTKDVFSGRLLNVRERSASSTLKDGEIIFGLVVPVQSIALVEALAPFSFPPIFKTHLIHVRQRNELQDHPDMALRSLYFALAEAYLNPKPPELHNTDGDRLEPRTPYFDIDSPQIAFDALASLAVGTTPDELLEDGEFDRSGSLVEATIPWIKPTEGNRVGLKTVLMGRIRIENRKLTVEVNSVARAKAVRARIEQSLGERARYRRSRKQSMESVVPPITGGPGIRAAARSAEDEELMQHPEVRAQHAEMQRRHYESWPDTPLPALNGRTPLDAVKDPDGREMVEALLKQFERNDAAMPVPSPPEVFSDLRARLGLLG